MNKYNSKIAILAAGKGIRMKSKTPKALKELNNKPMICHIIETVGNVVPLEDIVIVVSNENKKEIMNKLGKYKRLSFCIQHKALGTGDAVKSVLKKNKFKEEESLLVLLSDHPLIREETIKKLLETHRNENSTLTMLTSSVPDYNGPYKFFYYDGRIIRDEKNRIKAILEPNELSKEEMSKFKEINPSIYLFRTNWLKKNIGKIMMNEEKGEYYLTHLIGMAVNQGVKIESITVDALESFGINTVEQLGEAEKIVSNGKLE